MMHDDQVLHLSRRMLFDQVDAVRRSAAEQLIMAARIDLDRCPSRLLHHVPGACSRQSRLPALSSAPPHPLPSPLPSPPPTLAAAAAAAAAAAGGPADGERQAAPESPPSSAVGPGSEGGTSTEEGEGAQAWWDGSAGEAGGDGAGSAALVTEAASAASPSSLGEGGGGGGGGGGSGDAEGVAEEPLVSAATVFADGEAEASPAPALRQKPSPERREPGGQVSVPDGDGGGAEEGERVHEFVAVQPLDRAGACGLWLLLVVMPLIGECSEGSYRTKLLALHMIQVGREDNPCFFVAALVACVSSPCFAMLGGTLMPFASVKRRFWFAAVSVLIHPRVLASSPTGRTPVPGHSVVPLLFRMPVYSRA